MPLRDTLSTWIPFLTGFLGAPQQPKPQPVTTPQRSMLHGMELMLQQSYLYGRQPAPYNPDDLVGKKGLMVYRDMLRDEQVKSAIRITEKAVLASGFDVVAPELPEDADQTRRDEADEQARLCNFCISEMKGTYESKLIGIMSARQYGFSISELVFDLIDFGEFDGKIKLADIKTRHPWGLDFEMDAFGNLLNLIQANKPIAQLWKFLIYSYQSQFANYYGESELRAAYRPWWVKENVMKFMTIALERHATPLAKWSSDVSTLPTEDQRQAMQDLIDHLTVRTGVIIPPGFKLEFDQTQPNTNTVFVPILKYLDERISISQLVPGLIGMGGEQQTGSLARSGTEFETFLWVVQNLRKDLETLQDEGWIKPVIDMNYPDVNDGLYPKFKFNPLTEAKKKEIYDSWLKGITGKALMKTWEDENKARELIGFDPIEEKDWDVAHQPGVNDEFGNKLPPPQAPPGGGGFPFALDADEHDYAQPRGSEWNILHPRYPKGHPLGGRYMPLGPADIEERKRLIEIRRRQKAALQGEVVDNRPVLPKPPLDPMADAPRPPGSLEFPSQGQGVLPLAEPAPKADGVVQADPAGILAPREAKRKNLSSGDVKSEKILGGGIEVSKIVELADGTKAVWKPHPENWKREVAAVEVGEILGMEKYLPPTVVRTIKGEIGSLQEFRNGGLGIAANYRRAADSISDRAKADGAAFDYLIGNRDRHNGNWLTSPDYKTVVLIDHGRTLNFSGDVPYIRSSIGVAAKQLKVKDSVVSGWAGKWDEIEKTLKNRGLDNQAIAAAQSRFNRLLAAATNNDNFESLPLKFMG